jgi:parallel beta-helix repeat protein
MKKIVGFLVFTLAILSAFSLTVSSVSLNGNTIYVDDDGGEDYTSIQDAIDAASDGCTIFVYSGTYYEHIEIYKSVILQGEDKESTIIDGGGDEDVIFVTVDNVEITGFSIINSGSDWIESGIHLRQVDHCLITENIISNCGFGIVPFITSDVTISMNTISDCKDGIFFVRTTHANITRNSIQNNLVGIHLNGVYYSDIMENNFIDNNLHASFYGAFQNRFNGNYWERLVNIGPKIIFGRYLLLNPIQLLAFAIDWNPALEPYDLQMGV